MTTMHRQTSVLDDNEGVIHIFATALSAGWLGLEARSQQEANEIIREIKKGVERFQEGVM